MITKIKYSLLFCYFLSLLACQKDTCFYGTGELITKRNVVEPYSCVQVYGMFDIELINDSVYSIEEIGGEKVLEKTDYSIENDTLFIHDHNYCYWLHDRDRIKYKLSVPKLKRIDLYEAAYLHASSFKTEDLYVTAQGDLAEIDLEIFTDRFGFYSNKTSGGKYSFKGEANYARLMGFYLANLNAEEFECRELRILNASIADFRVWASEKLTVEIYNKGNILYKGTPDVLIDSLSSTGRVYKLEE